MLLVCCFWFAVCLHIVINVDRERRLAAQVAIEKNRQIFNKRKKYLENNLVFRVDPQVKKMKKKQKRRQTEFLPHHRSLTHYSQNL